MEYKDKLYAKEFQDGWKAAQNHLSTVNYQLPHIFNAPNEDKGSRFCRCGKYLTDDIHLRKL